MGWFDCNGPTEKAGRQSVKGSLNPHVEFMRVLVLPRELSNHSLGNLWREFLRQKEKTIGLKIKKISDTPQITKCKSEGKQRDSEDPHQRA